MGMHRYFTLTAETKNGDEITAAEARKIEQELAECCVGGWEGMLDQEALTCSDANWYDWEEEMGAIAADHPGIVFTLFCMGETLDDTWQAGFCGNRFDYQEAIIPDLDMDFLRGE